MDPFQELESHFAEVVGEMPPRFNTHEFIRRLAWKYQRDYVRALAVYVDSEAQPFQITHSRLGKMLADHKELIRYIGQEPSEDIFGNTSEVALWGRR